MLSTASEELQHELKADYRLGVMRITREHNRSHQLAAVEERVTPEVVVRITIENRIGGKVQLCNQGLMAGDENQVVHMLADPVWIVARDHSIELVCAFRINWHLGAIAVSVKVIMAEVIGLPNLDHGTGKHIAARVEHLPSHRQGHAGVTRCSERGGFWGAFLIEGADFVRRRRPAMLCFPLRQGFENA
jgi:hypothetical protein